MPLEPGQMLGHYRLRERVGEGGMGVVWSALDTTLGREVALKLLPDAVAQDPVRLERLESEARAIAALNHPGIVTLYSIEEAEARRFLTMELVTGRSLAELIPAEGMPFREVLRLALPLAEAVSAAHRRGIVHRDLKPRNVMVTAEGQVKVLDFGLAQSPPGLANGDVSDRTTRTRGSGLTGTLAYMSPEQLQGLPADPRSDVFSLGVLFYEMATGRRPFEAKSAAELVSAILRDVPIPPTRLRPGLPGRVDRLVARCLEKEPRYRLQSAVDLLWELEQVKAEAGREVGEPRTLAVLPFADQSREKDQDYLCDGLAEDVLIALSKVKGLRVASRAASFRFRAEDADVKETGRRLGVEAIVHGSVRRTGSRLRLAVELVDVVDGFEIWAEVYERGVEDVFAVQGDVTRAIARALKVDVSASEHPSLPAPADVEAWDYSLQARKFFYQYSKKGMRFARELFERAIAKDPAYGRAWSGLSDCAAFLYANAGRHPEDLEQADGASRRALELEPDLAEAHASRGVTLSLRGRHEEAEQAFETAIRLDPQLFEAHYFYARDVFARGDLEKAIRQYEEAIRVRPEDYQSPLLVAQSFEDLGRADEAQAMRRRGVRIAEEHLRLQPDDARALYMGANGLVALGETKRGLEWADRALALDPEDPMLLYNIACIRSMAGAGDAALDCLERSVAAGLRHKGWLEHDSNLDAIRAHPRFQALMASL
jgi:TolB-like protein/Tfp pilus assembly protein PilF